MTRLLFCHGQNHSFTHYFILTTVVYRTCFFFFSGTYYTLQESISNTVCPEIMETNKLKSAEVGDFMKSDKTVTDISPEK